MLTEELVEFYKANGYVVVPGLFSRAEVADLLDHYMTLRKSPQPRDDTGVDIGSEDPIKRYPRMIQPQRYDERTRQWMLDPRLNECLTGLLGNEPYAAQNDRFLAESGLARAHNSLRPVGHLQLAKDVGDIIVDGLHAQ